MTKYAMALAAMFFTGAALADIPPPPPDDPLGPDCRPFIGVWTPSVPEMSRGWTSWRVIAIGSEKASVIKYMNLQDVNMQVESSDARVTCEATADGLTVLTFALSHDKFILSARLTGETSFTTERVSQYTEPGPPPEDWKGETIVTTWTRIAR